MLELHVECVSCLCAAFVRAQIVIKLLLLLLLLLLAGLLSTAWQQVPTAPCC
jgi:hypothetical protein